MPTPSQKESRSIAMVTVALFLSKYGPKKNVPPGELKVDTWKQAYACFFRDLGSKRTLTSFANSLKNARDLFDSHMENAERSGWREEGAKSPPAKLPRMARAVWDAWQTKSREDFWAYVKKFSDPRIGELLKDHKGILESAFDQIESTDLPDECPAKTEGGEKSIVSSRVERDPGLRADALRIHGYACQCCGFEIGKIYGKWGHGFAEVHHRKLLSENKSAKIFTNPKTDLVVLCANCHRMVHRKRNLVLTLEELRDKIDKAALAHWANTLASAIRREAPQAAFSEEAV